MNGAFGLTAGSAAGRKLLAGLLGPDDGDANLYQESFDAASPAKSAAMRAGRSRQAHAGPGTGGIEMAADATGATPQRRCAMTHAGTRTNSKSDISGWAVTSVYALVMLVLSVPLAMNDVPWTDTALLQRHTLLRLDSLIHSSVPGIVLMCSGYVSLVTLAWLFSRSKAVAVTAGVLTFLSYVFAMCVAFWSQPFLYPEMPASERDISPIIYPTLCAGEHIGLALALRALVWWALTRRRQTST